MEKYILLECNRLRGKQTFNNLEDETDKYKNNWTNIVSTSGIVVNAGDTINLEQVILNSKGASDDVIEFLGEENEEGFVDNKCNLEYSFYINHCGQNTARMPFIYHKTYRGNGTILNPDRLGTGDSATYDFKNANPKTGTDANLKTMLSRRSLGETFFPVPIDSTTNAREWNINDTYPEMNNYYMSASMVLRLKTIQTGGGTADLPNSGYIAGALYNTQYTNGDSGTGFGLIIRVESVTTSGNVGGIVNSWSVYNIGRNFDNAGTSAPRLALFQTTGAEAVVGTQHILQMFQYPTAETYSQSGLQGFGGNRFSFLNAGYSGLANENEGISLNDPNSTDTSTIISVCDKRKKKINLNVDEGFMTPDNLGAILTDQLHEPSLVNSTNDDKADYLDYKTLNFFHRTPTGQFSNVSKPVIVSTPTYQPQSVNMCYDGIPNTTATLISARRGFYQQLAYKNSERYSGLKNCFWNFNYLTNDFSVDNDITSGTIDSGTIPSIGDFSNLQTGDLGCRACILNSFPEVGDTDLAGLKKYGLVMTNLRWTKSNIDRLKTNFKKAEYYLGDLTKNIDTSSDDYKQSLAVNLDLGMYDDELSAQFPLTKDPNKGDGSTFVGQRRQFANYTLGTNTNKTEYPVDYNWYAGANQTCQSSTIRNFPSSIDNDGQELPSIWVKSRWEDGFTYDNAKDASYTDNKLNLEFLSHNINQPFDTNTSVFPEKDFFKQSWIDNNGVIKSTLDAIQDAIDADLAIVPIFPQNFASGKFNVDPDELPQDQQPPYICFVNAMEVGQQSGTFDYSNLGNDNNKWEIDFWNVSFGTQIGFDHSFTRNEAVIFVSPMVGNEPPFLPENYMNVAYLGAVNPSIGFNPQLSRFELTGLNTPQNIGNGLLSDIPELIEANPNPEQTCFKVMRTGQICQSWEKMVGDNIPQGGNEQPYSQIDGTLISQFDDSQQEEGTLMDSQSGIAIEGLYLFDMNGNETQIQNTDIGKYKNTLFEKMGFDINQLLPDFGDANAFFTNQFTFQSTKPTYGTGILNITKPATTGSYISSAEIQTLSLNELNMPLYDLGVNCTRQATPDASNGSITAFKLADKLSFPYFCIYSSIPNSGTDTQWVGGDDGHSTLPCMGYLTRENNIGDFYYNAEQTFQYTATKDFTLTEVETDIRLPDGTRPRFEGHSAVIYKITKPLTSLPAPPLVKRKSQKPKK